MVPAWLKDLKRPLQVGCITAALVALVSIFMPNYYASEARLLPPDSKASGLAGLASAAAAFGITVPGGDSSDNNFVDILKSRWLYERLLTKEFQFREKSWRFGKERAYRQTLEGYLQAPNRDRALGALATMITVTRDTKTKVISLVAETKSPELSQGIVQQCTQLLEDFLHQKDRTRGGAKAVFAEARLVEARGELDQAEANLRGFLDGNRNYTSSADPAVRLRGLRLEAELKLRQQLVMTLALNREQALMEEKNDVPIVNVMDKANLPIDKSRPHRAKLVQLGFLLGTLGALGWKKRRMIWERLMQKEDPELPAPKVR